MRGAFPRSSSITSFGQLSEEIHVCTGLCISQMTEEQVRSKRIHEMLDGLEQVAQHQRNADRIRRELHWGITWRFALIAVVVYLGDDIGKALSGLFKG